MANTCLSTYRITGSDLDLDTLQGVMLHSRRNKENGNWIGHIVEHFNDGKIPEHIHVRGWWSDLSRWEDCLYFSQESAWEPLYEAWDFIAKKLPSLQVYFIGEEPGCELFLKRDNTEKGWFPYNYYLDMCTPQGEYESDHFKTIGEALRFIENKSGERVYSIEETDELSNRWNDENPDAFIILREFETV